MADNDTARSSGFFGRIGDAGRRVKDSVKNKLTQIGNNIESIILYGRLKDFYKLLDVASPFLTAGLLTWVIKDKKGTFAKDKLEEANQLEQRALDLEQKAYAFGVVKEGEDVAGIKTMEDRLNRIERHLYDSTANLKNAAELKAEIKQLRSDASDLHRRAEISSTRIVDTINGVMHGGISAFSNWVDKKGVVTTYETVLRKELGIADDRPVTFQDARHSTNPIIQKTAEYYTRKSRFRHATDLASGINFVKPEMDGKPLSGMRAVQGAKSIFFAWYFIERFTGSHYSAINIWNKTEGVATLANRAVNKGTNPGEPVSLGDIIDLYENYQKEQELGKSFTTDEKLTRIVFQQMARYMNANYISNLLDPKDVAGSEGTSMSFDKLIEFVGRGGIDIDSSLKTAALLEIIARTDIPTFMAAHEEMKNLTASDFARVDEIAMKYLDGNWPPGYVETRIRPDVLAKYDGIIEAGQLPKAKTITLQIDDGDGVEMARAIVSERMFNDLSRRYPVTKGGDFVMSKLEAKALVGDLDGAQAHYVEELRQEITEQNATKAAAVPKDETLSSFANQLTQTDLPSQAV